MAGAGGEDGDVAGRDLEFPAGVAAEPDPGMAARDAERFVNRGVVVQIIVDAVAPHVAPAMGAGYWPLMTISEQKGHSLLQNGPLD